MNYHCSRGSIIKFIGLLVFGLILTMTANVNVQGQLADTFNPNPDSSVFAIKIQADGKILIGGFFTNVGGQPRSRIARLNPDGTLDTTFVNANVNGIVYALAIQPDGKFCWAVLSPASAVRRAIGSPV